MVYLIHLEKPLGNDRHQASHYIGFTPGRTVRNLEKRFTKHVAGHGSAMLRAANERGISYDVVRAWRDGDRTFERQLKNRKNAKQLCPCCGAPLVGFWSQRA
jgi:predicted GIY-YIG superfamily endonuclease